MRGKGQLTMVQFNTKNYDAKKYLDELKAAENPPIDVWAMVGQPDWRRLFHRFIEDQETMPDDAGRMAALAFLLDDNRDPGTVWDLTTGTGMFVIPWSRDSELVHQEDR